MNLLLEIEKKYTRDTDKLAKTLRLIIINVFEKACFEEKFVRLYP